MGIWQNFDFVDPATLRKETTGPTLFCPFVRLSLRPSLRGGSGKISRELKETENNAKILLLRGVGWEQSETKSEWEARAGSTAPPFVSHP